MEWLVIACLLVGAVWSSPINDQVLEAVANSTNGNDFGQDDTFSCPVDPIIKLSTLSTVRLDPVGEAEHDPNFEISDDRFWLVQTLNSDPGLAVFNETYGGLNFEGTFIVDTNIDDDFVGFVFGYQNSKQFYLVTWKKQYQTYWQRTPSLARSDAGLQLKLVNSKTGPGPILRNALWNTNTTTDQVYLLWKDTNGTGWEHKTYYKWQLIHRPRIGLIRVAIFKGDHVIADSGNVFDSTLKGGRVGVYSFSQEMVKWSGLFAQCYDKVPRNIASELPKKLQGSFEVDEPGVVFPRSLMETCEFAPQYRPHWPQNPELSESDSH